MENLANWASLKQHLVDQLTGNAEGAHEVTGFDSSTFLFVWRKHTHRLDCQLKRTASKLGTLQILKWLLSSKAAVEQKSLESQKTFHSMLTLGMDIWAPSIHDRNLHPDFIIHTTRNEVKKGKSWRQIKCRCRINNHYFKSDENVNWEQPKIVKMQLWYGQIVKSNLVK